jgi:tetratricopeptide (TPR) repeat protein
VAAVERAQGRPEDAERWLLGPIGADPGGLTRFEACRLLVAEGRGDEALDLCRNAPATAPYWLSQGIAADEAGRLDEAILYFDLARGADRNRLEAWERLGRAIFRAERPAEAIAVYEHLLSAQARPSADTFYQLGLAYGTLGRLDEARAVLEQGLGHYPFQREIQLALADTARAAGDPMTADAWYAGLLEQLPGDAYAWARRGELALQDGRPAEALTYLARATAIEPDEVGYWLGLAAAATVAGNVERAAAAYEEALALRPEDIALHLEAARFFAQANEPEKARALYEQVLSLEPGNSAASDALATLAGGAPTP